MWRFGWCGRVDGLAAAEGAAFALALRVRERGEECASGAGCALLCVLRACCTHLIAMRRREEFTAESLTFLDLGIIYIRGLAGYAVDTEITALAFTGLWGLVGWWEEGAACVALCCLCCMCVCLPGSVCSSR